MVGGGNVSIESIKLKRNFAIKVFSAKTHKTVVKSDTEGA